MSLERFLYSLVGWSTIGNSNWFIFDTLVMYIFTYAAFKLCRQKEKAVSLITIATMIFSSIYGIVDGFFVSNFAGKTPFAS
ncbi:MAG: hypothetical protein ACSW8B_00560, partial [bacterium]